MFVYNKLAKVMRVQIMKKSTENLLSGDNEQVRLSILDRYKILDTPAEDAFDNLATLACTIFDLPICLISFIGRDEIFYKANIGFSGKESEPRKGSMLDLTGQQEDIVVSESLVEHRDFFYSMHNVSFFAAVPLVISDGHIVGSLALMGSKRVSAFSEKKQEIMRKLAKTVVGLVESRLVRLEDQSIRKSNEALIEANKKITARNMLLTGYNDQIAKANSTLENVLDSYELLFKYTPVAIGICSFEEKIIWQANEALNHVFRKGSELIGVKLETLISQINGKAACKTLDLVQANSNAYHLKGAKVKIHHAEGYRNIYADLSLQLVGRMGDESQNIMFILADVTEQVILSQIAREANEVLMNAIEDTGMGYTIVEFETGIMQSNAQLKANYGFSSEEAFSYPDIFNAMLPKYRQLIKKAVSDAILNKGIYQAEYEVKWRDGTLHRIRAYGKPMYDADGKATHIIGLNKVISST